MDGINQIINKLESAALKQPDDDNKTLKEQDTVMKTSKDQEADKNTSEDQDVDKKTSDEQDTNKKHSEEKDAAKKGKGFLGLPDELCLDIGSYLGAADNGRVRLVNKQLNPAFREAFFRVVAEEWTIYPRYDSFFNLFSLIRGDLFKARHVRKLVLVKDGLVAPANDYGWYWEELENTTNGFYFTVADWAIIRDINAAHRCDIYNNGNFLTGGQYRSALVTLFMMLPNLEAIEVRELCVGEHLPGWDGPELMKNLSLYHNGLYNKKMFYGGWKYDEIQKRVTEYVDEFGEVVTEPGAGPQATFKEDLEFAHRSSGTQAVITY